MRAGVALAGVAAMVAACGLLEPLPPDPRYALVLVNNTQEPRFWSIEQPTGQWTRFEISPCTSVAQDLGATQRWEVEWGAAIAVSSDEVPLTSAPFTLVEVLFQPDGTVDVAPSRGVPAQPDAPLEP